MKCPKCQFENPQGAKFCNGCGNQLELVCPECGNKNQVGSKYCNDCGQKIQEILGAEEQLPKTKGERKYVTVLFSDLSGYTEMSEILDPEEVKEITHQIFGQISEIVNKYEGFVEKFVGDAVMALFGVPRSHEDDAIRAIRAVQEIHKLVESRSPEVEKKTRRSIAMHTGVNTGLVVTGEVDVDKGIHGTSGDTINVASRLSGLAKPGEILVGRDTYRQAEGYFNFKELEPAKVKGKSEPLKLYKVLSVRDKPVVLHRPSGLQADLIGRKSEMDRLGEAVDRLREGEGTIFSIRGDAGTGKSRLVEEFKATLDLTEIQWRDTHAYAYSQGIPYAPLIDFLNRLFKIEDGDSPEKLRGKVEHGIEQLIGKRKGVVPYVGSLYSLRYHEVEDVSPEFWKGRLQETIQAILTAVAKKALTVFCLEDLHWADPSFLDLLRGTLLKVRQPAIILCVYRPEFNLFTEHQLEGLGKTYQEIQLTDLSPLETADMLKSLLKTKVIPSDLKRLVGDKAEGNPFYLEELVNSLIESETLVQDNGSWKITSAITESDMSSTIHGVISGRVDRLERETKRVLQEASVIGRIFLYEILRMTTKIKRDIDRDLRGLVQLDLIRTRSFEPDLEYMFKHALTQEVVYSGILKKERKEIHEQIANMMEHLFRDRLSEFYETLAFHYKKGESLLKAIDYLMKSGEKSLRRYAVEEAHQSYEEAFGILNDKPEKTKAEKTLLIDLVIQWCQVFYYRGDAVGLVELLRTHEDIAKSLGDKPRIGMLLAWFGYVLFWREKYRESYDYLLEALRVGEESNNKQVIGYACTWLPYTCAELGRFDEGIRYGKRAQEISKSIRGDRYLYTKSLSGIGYIHFFRGARKELLKTVNEGLAYGKRHSDLRSLGMGYTGLGLSHLIAGHFRPAIENCEKAVQVSEDPVYSMAFRTMLSFSFLSGGRFQEAEETAQKVVNFAREYGVDWLGTMAHMILSVVLIAKGHMSQGFKRLGDVQRTLISNESRWLYTQSEYILGSLYFQMVERKGPTGFSLMVKNMGFLIKEMPFASKRAEFHLNKAIEVAKEIGAFGVLGLAYLNVGLLHKKKRRAVLAKKYILEAIQTLDQCGAELYLNQAKEALESLPSLP